MADDDCNTGLCPPSEDPLDVKTFTPPVKVNKGHSPTPFIIIEFCNRCRWLHRATWVQTELFLTFPDEQAASFNGVEEGRGGSKYSTAGKGLKAITLVPCNAPETGGRFRVWLYKEPVEEANMISSKQGDFEDGQDVVLLWDRKIRGGFPELKELKQMIRDHIAPAHKLGHSDKKTTHKIE